MIYVSRVVSSCKGGVDVELGPRTLFTGKVGSGKSAKVNAVELPATGRASDLSGRAVVADESMLLALAPPDGRLFSEITLSNGERAFYETIKAASGKAKKATWTVPDSIDLDLAVTMPLRPLREAVLGAADTMRKFFLGHVGGKLSDSDVLARIPKELHGYYRQAIQAANVRAAPTDKLLYALETAKTKTRDAAAKVKEANAAVSMGASGAGHPVTDDELLRLKEAQKAAAAQLEEVAVRVDRQGQREDDAREFNALKQKWTETNARYTEATANITTRAAALKALPQIKLEEFDRALLLMLEWHTAPPRQMDACLVCGNGLPVQGLMDQRLAAARDAVAQTMEVESKRHVIEAEIANLNFDRDLAAGEIGRIEAQGRTLKARIEAQVSAAVSKANLDVAREALEAAQMKVVQAERAKGAWVSIARARDNAVSAERDANEWTQLVTACQKAVAELLDASADEFAARVQQFLPATDKFALRLHDGDKEVCQFGLMRGEALHTALSGGEWARVMAALATACARPVKDKLTLVIPEDRGLDPDALADAMEAFNNVPGQVILTSTVRPSREIEGWTIVDVTAQVSAPISKPRLSTDANGAAMHEFPGARARGRGYGKRKKAAVESSPPAPAPAPAPAVAAPASTAPARRSIFD